MKAKKEVHMVPKKPEDYFGRTLTFIGIVLIMLLLAGLLYMIFKPRRAHSAAECDPITLRGQAYSAWPKKVGGLELLVVVWLIKLPEEKFEAVTLLFLRSEVFAANFYNAQKRQTVTQITILKKGCRSDGLYVHALLGPPELILLQ